MRLDLKMALGSACLLSVVSASLAYSGEVGYQGSLFTLTPTGDVSASTFTLQDDYGWISIDPSTGVVTAQSSDLISGRFDVVILETVGAVTKNHNVDIVVYFDSANVFNKSTKPTLSEVANRDALSSTNQQASFKIPSSVGSTKWHFVSLYKPKYLDSNLDIVVADDNLAVSSVDNITNDLYKYNGLKGVISDEGKLYIDVSNASANRKISIYDPATKVITNDAVPITGTYNGEESFIELNPYNRLIYLCAQNGTHGVIASIDTGTNTFTELGTYGADRSGNDPRALDIASDADYIYAVVGRTPNVQLIQTAISGGAQTELAVTTDNNGNIDLEQYRWGVKATFVDVVGYTDGDYYIYQTSITPVAEGIPWVNQDGVPDYLGPEDVDFDGARYENYTGVDNLGNMTVQVSDLYPIVQGQTRDYPVVVRLFKSELFNGISPVASRFLVSGKDYAGYVNINTLDNSGIKFDAHASRVRFMKHSNGLVYFGGYPSQSTFELNPNQDVDDTTATFLGYSGGSYNNAKGHYIQGMCEGSDGLVYFSGVQYRTADSGSVGWFDPDDYAGTIDGFSDETDATLLDYGFNNCVAVGSNIVVSSFIVNGSVATNAKLYVLATTDKSMRAIDLGVSFTTTGHIASVSNSDVVIITSNPDTTLRILRVNIDTGAVVWDYSPTNMKLLIEQSSIQTKQRSVVYKDGYVYAEVYDISSTYHVIKINPSLGAIEFIGSPTTEEAFDIDSVGNMYFAKFAGEVTHISGATSINNMTKKVLVLGAEVVQSWDFTSTTGWSGSANWVIDTGAGTMSHGGQTSNDIRYQSTNAVAGQDYQVTIDVESTSGNVEVRFGGVIMYFGAGVTTRTISPSGTDAVSVRSGYSGLVATLNSLSIKPLINGLA